MKIHVLGSAAGGGFPQWNCHCQNCDGLRQGSIKATARTQSSIAVSADNEHWILFNASPDIRAQLEAFPQVHSKQGLRGTGIAAVVLVDSQIDHCTGLLTLREGYPLPVYGTEMVRQDLSSGFPLISMLKNWNGGMDWHPINLDGQPFRVDTIDSLQITAVALSGKAPPYSPHRHDPHPGDNIGLYLEDVEQQTSLFYAPGLGQITPEIQTYVEKSDCVLVDGTFWREDEMQHAGVGNASASSMGHLPQSGEKGMINFLRQFSDTRKILIHINNTNPILREDSPERQILEQEDIDVSFDGMNISLE